MSGMTPFMRKIVYVALIILILPLLVVLGQPQVDSDDQDKQAVGGFLAQMRAEHDLAGTSLGKLDPTAETARVVTLGFRNVAYLILNLEAIDQKKKKDWTNMKATVNQMIYIYPHQVAVWKHQAWNLAYNVTVEFDGLDQRYQCVIDGLRYLEKGLDYNKKDMRLLYDLGFTTKHKIGQSDEKRQFRKLFRSDLDYHWDDELGEAWAKDDRDSWKVGKYWYERAEQLVESDPDVRIQGTDDMLFYNCVPICEMYFASTWEKDGKFDNLLRCAQNWKDAEDAWLKFGNIEFNTGIQDESLVAPTEDNPNSEIWVRLADKEEHDRLAAELITQLDDLAPGAREELPIKRRESLSEEERQAIDTPSEERTAEQHQLVSKAEKKMQVTHMDVAGQAQGADRAVAFELARKIEYHQRMSYRIMRERRICNYEEWLGRARREQMDEMVLARKLVWDGNVAFENGKDRVAMEMYKEAFALLNIVVSQGNFPELLDDVNFRLDMEDVYKQYVSILQQRDMDLVLDEEPFLKKLIEKARQEDQ